MSEVIFEDNFDTFDTSKWKIVGSHPKFNVTASNGWLHILFDKIASDGGYYENWASVCTRAPLDLSNKTVKVRFDLEPKKISPEHPVDDYCVGVMLANKETITGNPIFKPDADLNALIYLFHMVFQTPVGKLAFVVNKGVPTHYLGVAPVLFPPTEFELLVGLTKVTTMEEGVEDLTLPLTADPTNLYLHLFVFQVEDGVYILPSRASFDYVKVEKGPYIFEYPKPEVSLMSMLQQVLPAIMMLIMVSSILRIVGRIK